MGFEVKLQDWHYSEEGVKTDGPGWTPEHIEHIQKLLSRLYPLMRRNWGPPAHADTRMILDKRLSSVCYYRLPPNNIIHLGGSRKGVTIHPEVMAGKMVHEIYHAYRGPSILSSKNGKYDPFLSAFTEGMAQFARYQITREYNELYPDDKLHWREHHYNGWRSDYTHQEAHATEQFGTTAGGLGIFGDRYSHAADVINKIALEDPEFIENYAVITNQFHKEGTPNSRYSSIRLLRDASVPKVENASFYRWIDSFPIMQSEIVVGPKVYLQSYAEKRNRASNTDPDSPAEYIEYLKFAYYHTFPNGSDWHDGLHGHYQDFDEDGEIKIYDYSGNVVFEEDMIPTARDGSGFAKYRMAVTSSTAEGTRLNGDVAYWEGKDNKDFRYTRISEPGLYRINIKFRDIDIDFYRVLGSIETYEGHLVGLQSIPDGATVKAYVLLQRNSVSGQEQLREIGVAKSKNGLAYIPGETGRNRYKYKIYWTTEEGRRRVRTNYRNLGDDYRGIQMILIK